MIIRAAVGVDQVNVLGRLPLEVPTWDFLSFGL